MLSNGSAPARRAISAEALLWMLLVSSSALYFFWTNEADNDLWGHVRFGRDILLSHAVPHIDGYAYTTLGQPWIDHEWLSQLCMAWLYTTAGSAGLVVAKFAVALATLGLVLARVRRRRSAVTTVGVIGLLTVASLARGFGIRPQVVTYLLLSLLLLVLDDYVRGRRGRLWLLPAMFLVWANLHGGFVLGLGILGLFACADLLRPQPSWQPWMVAAASAAITTLNPYGPRLLLYIWNELSRPHPISEWQPAAVEVEHLAFFTMLGLFAITMPFARAWRRDGWETLLAAGAGILALRHQRHTPVFALCAAAPLAAQLDCAWAWVAQRTAFRLSRLSRYVIAAAIAALAVLQLGLTAIRYRTWGLQIAFNPFEYPVAAVRALRQAGVQGNLAVPLDWGEYVLWFLAPQIKVSFDGRFATVFPERVVEDNFNFFLGTPGWQRLLDEYPTQAALVPAGWPCPIGTLPNWRRVYRDRLADVYLKVGERGDAVEALPQPVLQSPIGIFP